MKSFPKSTFSIGIALYILSAFASGQVPCLNNQAYRYRGGLRLRSCSNIRNKEKRRQKLCVKPEVRSACPQTCGLCCDDNPSFQFPIQYTTTTKACGWISKNKKNAGNRRKNYCTPQNVVISTFPTTTIPAYTTIFNMCPKACELCKSEVILTPKVTSAPVKSPTGTPSISAKPVETPSRPPSPFPSPFPTARPTNSPSVSPSDNPSKSPVA